MSGLSSSLNYYQAAGSIPRGISDTELPYYISQGGVQISGENPDLQWIQSSLSPVSNSIVRLWNVQLVGSTTITNPSDYLRITITTDFPMVFQEPVRVMGNFSMSPSSTLYNAYRYWTVIVDGSFVTFSFLPVGLNIPPGTVEFFLNFQILSDIR